MYTTKHFIENNESCKVLRHYEAILFSNMECLKSHTLSRVSHHCTNQGEVWHTNGSVVSFSSRNFT